MNVKPGVQSVNITKALNLRRKLILHRHSSGIARRPAWRGLYCRQGCGNFYLADLGANPPARVAAEAPPRLLYVTAEDWAFLSHRLPMARAAREAGFDVHVATRVQNGTAAIAAEGFTLHPIPFARGSLSPLATLTTLAALRRVNREVAPDVTHHVALQSSVLGLIATFGRRIACVNAFIGLGYAFTSASIKARAVKFMIGTVLRRLVDRDGSIALVQNGDDRAALMSLGITQSRIALISGSGVDVDRLTPLAEPPQPLTFGFVGRLLDDKGVRTLVEAFRLLRTRGSDARLLIAGTPDPANPASVTEAEAASWNKEPGITWLGHVEDIAGLWARAHIAVLPSRREGLPLSLMEAAACGRAMIASDVPGCREVVIHEQTGLLFPVDDAPALAAAMERLARSPDLRARYGLAARNLAVEKFASDIIGRQTVELYRKLLGARG
jgi:glycosyltransferase involved in cell wall biosynthesis